MSVASGPAKVFLAIPHYGQVCSELISSLFNSAREGSPTRVFLHSRGSSALTFNFNQLWADALNRRDEGFTHFAMLHSDLSPEPGWIDDLLDELQKHQAAVVSTVIPIKDQRGVTTTAFGKAGTIEVIKRLTIREARRLPKTFTAAEAGFPENPLLINTGCWICDLRQPWVDEFPGFTIVDGLYRDPATKKLTAKFFSEDWYFGLWLAGKGLKVCATTAVKLGHHGNATYRNDFDWGVETDEGDAEAPKPIPIGAKKPAEPAPAPAPATRTREIVAVRYAEDMGWLHNWLDDLLVKHGPDLTYRIYDKGPGGDTPNIGNLDWTYLHHIVNRWDDLADWTVFTQADPFPHLEDTPFEALLEPAEVAIFPFLRTCKEWNGDGRIHWLSDEWKQLAPSWYWAFKNGSIRPAKLSLVDWFKEFIGLDINDLGSLMYHPGAIFGVSRELIRRRPRSFYERLLANLGESEHARPEEAHYMERAWAYVFGTGA